MRISLSTVLGIGVHVRTNLTRIGIVSWPFGVLQTESCTLEVFRQESCTLGVICWKGIVDVWPILSKPTRYDRSISDFGNYPEPYRENSMRKDQDQNQL